MSSCNASVSPAVKSSSLRADSFRSRPAGRFARSLVLPCLAAVVSVGAVYGALAVPSAIYGASDTLSRSPTPRLSILNDAGATHTASLRPAPARGTAARLLPSCSEDCVAGGKARRLAAAETPTKGARLASPLSVRFDGVVHEAALSEKLADAFRKAGSKDKSDRVVASTKALPEGVLRRMEHSAPVADPTSLVLAYATTEKSRAARALDILSDAEGFDRFGLADDDDGDDSVMLVPDFEDTPDETPLPMGRPSIKPAEKPAPRATREDADDDAPANEPTPRKKLTYAKPDSPEPKKGGGLFDRWLGGKRAGNGVAVYDISAAKVYMPDGSVLEAHSGIGKMADNPRYVHVKMNGPTPPHTYNLKMREKRFHGVEAIRMLPVDGKNKHGRDGFLTHSYLLRGGRAESHGCVAFKEYDKFLKAFKQGKVKQLVVVPSGGRSAAVQMASR